MESSYYRIMALDYGDVRIGIALTDVMRTIASPIETLVRTNLKADLNYLANLIKEKQVKIVVFGLPLNMDGTSGIRVEKTKEFANSLKKLVDVQIDYMDERLSSVEAEKMLIESNASRKKRKDVIDKIAATIILQEYLNEKGV